MSRRTYAPVSPPVALTIAGSDSGGGAGIQADLKTMEAHDVFGTTVVTATTAQNTVGVHDVTVLPTDHIAAQYEAVAEDFEPRGIKTGMLATTAVIETVVDCLDSYEGPIVVDPVMVAATGDRLLDEAAEAAYETLIGQSTLVTPNTDEAEILTGTAVDSPEAAEAAGETLCEMGADAALLKGGHLDGDSVVDTLVVDDADGVRTERFTHPRIDTEATHGSGCTLSSAITARLATGESLTEAVAGGVGFMERAVRYGINAGTGPGAVHHMVELRERADRTATVDAVERLVARLVKRNVETLVPAEGMDVVGATRYAETPAEIVGVDGKLSRTRMGIRPTAGVRSGTASDLAGQLLALREPFPALRFAVSCRFDPAVKHALETLDGPVVSGAIEGLSGEQPPAAVIDTSGERPPTSVILCGPDAEIVRKRTLAVSEALLTE